MTVVMKKNGNGLPKIMNDLFEKESFFAPGIFDKAWDFSILTPSVNIKENGKDYKIELAAPGLEKKDFKIELEDNVLTISSEKEEEKKEEKEDYKRREFSYNSFCRSFSLPEDVVADKIDAVYENGILKLSVPKKEQKPLKAKKEIKIS